MLRKRRRIATNFYLVTMLLVILFALSYVTIYKSYFEQRQNIDNYVVYPEDYLKYEVWVSIKPTEEHGFVPSIDFINTPRDILTGIRPNECIKSITIGWPAWFLAKRSQPPQFSIIRDRRFELNCDNTLSTNGKTDPFPLVFAPGSMETSNLINFVTEIRSYYYPFDHYFLDMYVYLEVDSSEDIDTQTVQIAPNIHIIESEFASRWQPKYAFCEISSEITSPCDESLTDVVNESNYYMQRFPEVHTEAYLAQLREFTIFTVDFQRPFAQKLLTIVVLISILAFIILLMYLDDVGSFAEVSVGILLGLWGIQDILIPANINVHTIVHDTIFILYILLAFAVFARLVIKPLLLNRFESDINVQANPEPPIPLPDTLVQETNSLPNSSEQLDWRYQAFALIVSIGSISLLLLNRWGKKR